MSPREASSAHVTHAVILLVAVAAGTLPFVGKAFHIDDPVYVWVAQHILDNPLDPYGFSINWEHFVRPVSHIQQNPPLVSYFIAVVGFFFGWSETALHGAFFLVSSACVLGVYALSVRLCARPLVAALACLLAPVFLVSSTTLMSDVLMVTFWVWAVTLWMAGMEKSSTRYLVAGAALVTLSGMTKYFGFSLVPLLVAYSLVKERRPDARLALLLVPVVAVVLYQLATAKMYGLGMLAGALDYATNSRVGGGALSRALTTLSFFGGGTLAPLLLMPVLWSAERTVRVLLYGAVTVGALFVYLYVDGGFREELRLGPRYVSQLALFAVAGFGVVSLAWHDWHRRRTAESALLSLWVLGTLVFCVFLNWTVSGRNILPVVPAVALLLARQLEDRGAFEGARRVGVVVALTGCACVGLLASYADYVFAATSRDAARELSRTQATGSRSVRFQGHWGFQYYMEERGAEALDKRAMNIREDDVLISPVNNSYVASLSRIEDVTGYRFRHVETVRFPSMPWLTTVGSRVGAGFYSDLWGRLPFSFGGAPDDEYLIHVVDSVGRPEPPAAGAARPRSP